MIRSRLPVQARPMIAAVGQRVRELRTAAHLSQAALGQQSRVGQKFIGQLERGEVNVSLVTLSLLADALGCELANLIPSNGATSFVPLRAEDVRRAQDALRVIASILQRRKLSHG